MDARSTKDDCKNEACDSKSRQRNVQDGRAGAIFKTLALRFRELLFPGNGGLLSTEVEYVNVKALFDEEIRNLEKLRDASVKDVTVGIYKLRVGT